MPPPEALDVFDVCLATYSEARGLESADAEVHSVQGHDLDSLLAQVFDQIGDAKHSLKNLRLELCDAGEDDYRLDGVLTSEIVSLADPWPTEEVRIVFASLPTTSGEPRKPLRTC